MAGRGQQTLRIIGGQWRGRKFRFPEAAHLRPTPDRVRETLFNWLMPVIDGASCLDLFCGSGALGLEALSRGASHVSFVDTNKKVIQYLKQTVEQMQTDKADLFNGSAEVFLARPARPYDVVFLDPPYDLNLIPETARQLQEGNWLKPGVYIYIEHDGQLDTEELPSSWILHRDKITGQVHYSLYRCQE